MEARAHRGRPIRRERWSGRPRRIESNGVRSCRGACGACGASEAGEARAASCWVGSLRDVPSSPLRSPVLDQSEPPAPVGLKRAPHCRLLSLVDVHDSLSVRPSSILPRDQPLRSRGPSGGRPDTSTRPDAVRHGRHAVSFHPGQGQAPVRHKFFSSGGEGPQHPDQLESGRQACRSHVGTMEYEVWLHVPAHRPASCVVRDGCTHARTLALDGWQRAASPTRSVSQPAAPGLGRIGARGQAIRQSPSLHRHAPSHKHLHAHRPPSQTAVAKAAVGVDAGC
ncbi:hypothetical protein PCL_10012 [Purpureocillium lilacinum]|uniref:Uncharacterized protein n=1 Tax=Purpureocillium lilacinum TaxID=33203 RepID=A0A2U3EEQ3_PURLI|nr:hypothetical protein PCL_10012 [Purpureocillium lilacinum]